MSRFICGAAGTGKSDELLSRARLASQASDVLLTSPASSSCRRLRDITAHERITVLSFAEIALCAMGSEAPAQCIEDTYATALFEETARPLLMLEWPELLDAQIDPEVPGLRAPERFLDAARRLLCKLRDARISPEQFLSSALRGAAQFYGSPPNFATPDLLYYTKESHRDSLDVDSAELKRQYRREIDLAKILATLYAGYLSSMRSSGVATARDAVVQGIEYLQSAPAAAARFRERYPCAFVDDAEEATLAQLQLLQAIYGESLEAVTFAGDPASATSKFRGARPDRVFSLPGEAVELKEQRRVPFAIDAAARHLLGEQPATAPCAVSPSVQLFRASTSAAEAEFIAEYVAGLVERGSAPEQIALLFRSVANVGIYEEALLRRNIPAEVAGDLNLFNTPDALDALAVLWFVCDPFRHDYLLRMLCGGAMALSDATLQTLCAEPPDPQAALFTADPEVPPQARAGRWDAKRDLRLGWNVLNGDLDARLGEVARARVIALRERRARWIDQLRLLDLPALVCRIWSEGLARRGRPGDARSRRQQSVLQRLLGRAVRFAQEHPSASLAEFLDDVELRRESDLERSARTGEPGFVQLCTVDEVRGEEFEHVILPGARPGSFPRWYVPDAFLYSPSLGMIAKENAGEARSARTAKFSYYMFATKAREAYNREERQAFVYAMRRARSSLLVTASERPTRGLSAPEFLAELQAASLPGSVDFSNRWRPGARMAAAP